MPILRLNAGPDGPALEGSPTSAMQTLRSAAIGPGPVIVMIHGFKYDPRHSRHSPHNLIFADASRPVVRNKVQWLHHLGFGCGDPMEGLAVVFAWQARGTLWQAQRAACTAGRQLAEVIRTIHRRAPDRPIHVVTHSMGSEVIFEALLDLPARCLHRIVTLTGASYASRAKDAMTQTKAGRSAALINVISRENDPFDFAYERLIRASKPGDKAMGHGVDLPNSVTIQLDCSRTLATLVKFGARIAPTPRRMCHWSAYTRPGALRFYARILREPEAIPLRALQLELPAVTAPRWSRILSLRRNSGVTGSDLALQTGTPESI